MCSTVQSESVTVKNSLAGRGGGIRRGWDLRTAALLAACFSVWAIALMLPAGWGALAIVMLVLVLVLHSSLTHEILHGSPFGEGRVGTLIGLVQPGLLVPYLRFKRLHLAHHYDPLLTDPYDDPETNYLDPAVWTALSSGKRRLLQINNTLLGRMVVGPAIGMVGFVRGDLALLRAGDRKVALDWLVHLPGVALVLWLVSLSAMPIWAYLAACYGALSILKIRTFLEHRAHERAAARSVIIEDRGVLAFLFLNNNLHSVHHKHPSVPWYVLPRLYRASRGQFLARNGGYVYRSYGDVFRQHLMRTKDPVAHPLWPKG